LCDLTEDLAESQFGQGKHEEAFATFEEARKIVSDFALPHDKEWRTALARWLQRARDLDRPAMAASLEAEVQQKATSADGRVMILDTFRVRSDK
jgi:hypothetical protein